MSKSHNSPQSDSRAQILEMRHRPEPMRWREIAAMFRPVPMGTLARFAYDPKYEPRRVDYRRALGLPDYPPVTVRAHPCGNCGEIHIRKSCPKRKAESKPRQPRVRYSESAVSALVAAYQRAVLGVLLGRR